MAEYLGIRNYHHSSRHIYTHIGCYGHKILSSKNFSPLHIRIEVDIYPTSARVGCGTRPILCG